MWSGRHCGEGEGSKVEMVWTCNEKNEGETLCNQKFRYAKLCL